MKLWRVSHVKAHSRKSREAIEMGAKQRRRSGVQVSQVTAKVPATDKVEKEKPKSRNAATTTRQQSK